MRKLIVLVAGFIISVSAFAQSAEDLSYSAEVGVQAIARTVVDKKLVSKEAQKVLKLALETGKAGLGKMECDRGLGSDYCSFNVFIKDDKTTSEAEETLYKLDVRIIQGKIVSAKFGLIAG